MKNRPVTLLCPVCLKARTIATGGMGRYTKSKHGARCRSCWADAARARNAAAKASPVPCRHCGHSNVNRPRGLCFRCYYTPGLKDLYPSRSKHARRGVANFVGAAPLADAPTVAAPGSVEKVLVMIERALAGRALFHPGDARGAVPGVSEPQWQHGREANKYPQKGED